ncbi:hypothetical protein HYQ46_007388 [Verticillium longisporum]|nr:hypothetical protein HYQ46_007388 [Verticillium longisporum]
MLSLSVWRYSNCKSGTFCTEFKMYGVFRGKVARVHNLEKDGHDILPVHSHPKDLLFRHIPVNGSGVFLR